MTATAVRWRAGDVCRTPMGKRFPLPGLQNRYSEAYNLFGYVKPFKPELRICEFEAYKAVYCGLCRQLGKSFGAVARLTLSYDFTFLSMLHYAVSQEEAEVEHGRCCVNPLKKIALCGDSEALSFSADTAAIMIYYKLLDNIEDERALKSAGLRLLKPLVQPAHKKAADRRPLCESAIAAAMERQKALEAAGVSNPDEACEPTAAAMAEICKGLSAQPGQQRVLERLGYFVGRYVYLCDALDDMEQDAAKGGYNPYLLQYGIGKDSPSQVWEQARQSAKMSLYATIAEAAKAYELLELSCFQPILDNVLYSGMRCSVDEILSKKEKIR